MTFESTDTVVHVLSVSVSRNSIRTRVTAFVPASGSNIRTL
jgi:hypothetical protein